MRRVKCGVWYSLCARNDEKEGTFTKVKSDACGMAKSKFDRHHNIAPLE
jgi:hypothetical protein